MGSKTNNAENKILDHILRNVSLTSPTTIYVALFTSDPTETGVAGTEVSGGGYARVAVTFGAASGGSTSNSAQVNFATATATWGLLTHFVLTDSASGALTEAQTYYQGALTATKQIDTDDQAYFPAGNLVVTED